MRKLGIFVLAAWALSVMMPSSAFAGCTANLTCSNACGAALECPVTYFHITCQLGNQALSCSGNTSCNVGSNSIECDGTTYTCLPTNQRCQAGPTWVSCGSQQKNCPTCGGRVCNLSAPSLREFLESLEPLQTAPVTGEAFAG